LSSILALRKYELVTVSSSVRASLSRSTTRRSTGCTFDLLEHGIDRHPMLAHEALESEDAGAATLAGAGRPADLGHCPRTAVDGERHLLAVDDLAVADDHCSLVPRQM
jgi:hypothetical protein